MAIKDKPYTKPRTPEEFISAARGEQGIEPTKKLIVDIPLSLHTKLKMRAVQENTTIKKIVSDLLKEHIR